MLLYFLSGISGVFVGIMVLFNGVLSGRLGNLFSNVLIHGVGLVVISLICILGRYRFKNLKKVPLYLFAGGFIGIYTVLATNAAYAELGAAMAMLLGLAGQFFFSLILDHFGLFGTPKVAFSKKNILPLLFIGAGLVAVAFG